MVYRTDWFKMKSHHSQQDYHIVKLADSDDDSCTWPWYRKSLPQFIGKPLTILSWVLSLRFIQLLWIPIKSSHNHQSGSAALCYFGIQVSLLLARIIEDGWRLLCTEPRRRPRLRLTGDIVPRVDVVITTCGEDLDIILDTVKAMCDLDYPTARFRILVSDDSARESLEEEVASLAVKTPANLLYFARTRKGGMKAGNMNAALENLDSLGAAEYCAFADVDMAWNPDFLRATLPLLIEDEAVGVSVVPQRFYNVPTNDPLLQSLKADGELDEIQRDAMGCAWNTGPGIVFRRDAVTDVGGFPENALAEELLTGFKLQGRGWKVAYCHEELQWGLVPETFNAHVMQRTKWTVGRFRNARRLNMAIKSPLLDRMTWKQRVSAFCHLASPFTSIMNRVLCSWLLMILVASGQPLIAAKTSEELSLLFKTYLMAKLASRAEEAFASMSCGYFTLRRRSEGTYWLNVHLFFSLIKDMLPKSLGGIRIGFTPTALAESKIQERRPDCRSPLLQRFRVMFLRQGLWYHVIILGCAAAVVGRGLCASTEATSSEKWQYLLTHVLVPGAEWSTYFALFRPIAYAIWPPSMPERRDLMECTPSQSRASDKSGNFQPTAATGSVSRFEIWRPKPEQKLEDWDAWALLPELPRTLSLTFWCVVYLAWRA